MCLYDPCYTLFPMVYHNQGGRGHPTSLLLPQKVSHTTGNKRILKILGGKSLAKLKAILVKMQSQIFYLPHGGRPLIGSPTILRRAKALIKLNRSIDYRNTQIHV